MAERPDEVETLITVIAEKLRADRVVVARSITYGRLTWRRPNGKRWVVTLHPEI